LRTCGFRTCEGNGKREKQEERRGRKKDHKTESQSECPQDDINYGHFFSCFGVIVVMSERGRLLTNLWNYNHHLAFIVGGVWRS
jgi:hypothetical protein